MNNVSVKFAFIMILTVFAGAYEVKSAQDATASVNKSSVKYVFLFIGDGMGDNHKILAEQAFQNGHPGARLFMTRLPVQAKSITLNSDKQIRERIATIRTDVEAKLEAKKPKEEVKDSLKTITNDVLAE